MMLEKLNINSRKIDKKLWKKFIDFLKCNPNLIITFGNNGNTIKGIHYKNDIFIFISEEDNKDTISWVFVHELGHYMMNKNQSLNKEVISLYTKLKKRKIIKKSVDAEEVKDLIIESFCDNIATLFCGKNYFELHKRSKK